MARQSFAFRARALRTRRRAVSSWSVWTWSYAHYLHRWLTASLPRAFLPLDNGDISLSEKKFTYFLRENGLRTLWSDFLRCSTVNSKHYSCPRGFLESRVQCQPRPKSTGMRISLRDHLWTCFRLHSTLGLTTDTVHTSVYWGFATTSSIFLHESCWKHLSVILVLVCSR